jgi:hypothetical protein
VVSYRLWRGFSKKDVERGDWMSCNLTTEIALLGRSRHELVGTRNMGHLHRPRKIKVRAVQNYWPAIGPTATSYTSPSLPGQVKKKCGRQILLSFLLILMSYDG